MKGNKLKTKIISLIIVLVISIVLSGIISTILHLIFTKRPEKILNITFNGIINSLFNSEEHFEMFILIIISFMIWVFLSVFKVFDLKDYKSKTYKVTNNIEIPVPIGDKQTQQGSAWWLSKKELSKKFGVNRIDTSQKEIQELINIAKKEKEYIRKDIKNVNGNRVNTIFKTGGLVIGKKDKYILKVKMKKIKRYLYIPIICIKKVEDIYYVEDDLHSLTVGATRSGKTRNLVIQTIINLGLAGENLIISDPKGELFEYTSKTLETLGYKVLTLDFKNPLKSSKYNFLGPVIEAVNNKDIPKAVNYCADIVESLVGEVGNREAIWVNGEKSVIKAGIMAVVLGNKNNIEYQNLPNVYNFISKMCTEQEDKSMLIDTYLDTLEDEHPAVASFAAARIAPSRTRASFFTSALATLNIFIDSYVASMISSSDIDINKFNEEKTVLYMILPDEKTTFYGLCSLFVNQVYTKLVEIADSKGGRLKIRTNFILDEFGNFSAIPNFGGFLTVGGGRGIRFNLFVQSFSQLNEKYRR